ncbi:PRC-barrel domain-containing protein [Paracoccus halophilus]|uniref:PRC-barrel domain-containing protein n=1 Tax=Paracoccus halophilus TaxID=376733 RepID=A0A099EZG8_9RHOB|nr:PRC-barrel domain-containing protein [Paracoccus halophilus]KGJ03599.1 hypothetical protein IT41_13355 [Paracoccus halophilus]SFA58126.1 PRC-barrel domain-containing protein [Paracoccus halophilus]
MKSLVIAATTLAFAGAAYGQAESQTAPAAPQVEQMEEAATEAGNAAAEAAGDAAATAADAAAEAAQAAEDAAMAVGDEATDMGADAADAAAEAADEAAAAADQAADDAAMAADTAASGAGDMASPAEDSPEMTAGAEGETAAAPEVVAPDVNPPAISEADPGLLGSWLVSRRIWTTNQPSTTEWVDPMLAERPADWQDIAKVNDIVLDDSGQIVGYIADIGGFLGIGAKKVLLGVDAIHLVSIGNDTFFVTNYTKAELEALPDFDAKTVRN